MSNKRCAKCEKTVYPLEELKCLDKIWHKTCFKCWECGMTLSMKNYKGFDKKPYCNAHVPKAKHTQVAQTPEMARLAENTRIQSQAAYHGEFEKTKGKYTAVADDPETMRHQKNMEKISSVKYHADFEKMKGTKISVTDDPESARVKENQNVVSQVKYWGLQDKQKDMEGKRAMMQRDPNHPAVETQQYKTRPASSEYTQEEYRPSPHQSRSQGSTIYNSSEGGKVENAPTRRVGSISDYDPMNDQWGSLTTPTGGYGSAPGARQSAGGHQQQSWSETVSAPAPAGAPPPQQHSPRYEPEQRNYYPPPSQPQYEPPPPQQPPQQQYNPPPPAVVSPPASSNGSKSAVIYQAMYDYEAGDDDEVGFMDGDRIIDVEPIDAGWMIGTVQRTGQRGMLPANYVEKL